MLLLVYAPIHLVGIYWETTICEALPKQRLIIYTHKNHIKALLVSGHYVYTIQRRILTLEISVCGNHLWKYNLPPIVTTTNFLFIYQWLNKYLGTFKHPNSKLTCFWPLFEAFREPSWQTSELLPVDLLPTSTQLESRPLHFCISSI